MTDEAAFCLKGRNPDVLSCIANLSNDEVFTPPEFANRMLDTLAEGWAAAHDGADIWANREVTFLDPCTKSGVFLREITRRLIKGLEPQIPDLQARVDHILTRQVFGIGITQLTALLARRSLYCSKHANGQHSVATSFESEDGNVWFQRTEHSWDNNGKCIFCGASKGTLDRGEEAESHAYTFIHTDDIKGRIAEIFGADMQFDVIIGNPPYQLSDGGHGASSMPIYHKFVEQAQALEPRYLSMVLPARWLFGGRGLSEFRERMLQDRRVRKLVDFPDSRHVFPSVDIAGGICYFLWDRDNPGDCLVRHHSSQIEFSEAVRPLLENGAEVFVRNHIGINVLKKVVAVEATDPASLALPPSKRFDQQVSSQKPFGLRTYFRGQKSKSEKNNILVLQSGGHGWTDLDSITVGQDLVEKWKVFTSKSSSEHAGQVDKNGQRRVLSKSGVLPPGSVVTETYILIGAYDTEDEAWNCFSYVTTKLFRYLIATRSSAQDLAKSAYSFVPIQDFSQKWSDQELYRKYGLSDEEIASIERFIKPMDPDLFDEIAIT